MLDPRVLTASYSRRDAPQSFPLTDFYFVKPQPVEGNEYELIYYPAMMEAAPTNAPGAEARILAPGGADARKASLFTVFNKVMLPAEAITALREPDSLSLQDAGRTSIARVFDEFSERHRLLKELVIAKTLTMGVVHLDAAGRVLESSTGATMTCDFGVPASRRGNLSGAIAALWSDPAARIGDQIDAIRDQAEADGSEPPTEIWLHSSTKRHLRNNTQFSDWAKYHYVQSEVVLRGDMIPNLWGLNWRFFGGKYRSAEGTMVDFIPQTRAILTPPAGRPWMRAAHGSTLVPKSISIAGDVQTALQETSKFHGPFSYARLVDDPLSVYLYMGDKFGLHFADPNAVWQPTVFA
jgi:hypothetical protein